LTKGEASFGSNLFSEISPVRITSGVRASVAKGREPPERIKRNKIDANDDPKQNLLSKDIRKTSIIGITVKDNEKSFLTRVCGKINDRETSVKPLGKSGSLLI
jgi:hypothetical protein